MEFFKTSVIHNTNYMDDGPKYAHTKKKKLHLVHLVMATKNQLVEEQLAKGHLNKY